MSALLKRKHTSGESERAKRPRVDIKGNNDQQSSGGPTRSIPLSQAEQVHAASITRSKGKGKLEAAAAGNTHSKFKTASSSALHPPERRENIRKLAPPRPFPTVPTSVSASGPKSAQKEGNNLICITRHTPLAAYLSRCKKLLVDEGYKTLHLHGMGAAIPHLLILSVSLPPILPFIRDEIKVEVRTGTIEVIDEVIPEDEDEDMSLRARGKGGVSVVIQIGDGEALPVRVKNPQNTKRSRGKEREVVIVHEQDQEDDEMDQDEEDDEPENSSW